MPDQLLALLATVGWILVVAMILALFGTTSGGAWSIAGDVARGLRDWTVDRQRLERETSAARARPVERRIASPEAEVEDVS